MFGYNGNPSLTEVIAYAGYFAAIYRGTRHAGRAGSAVGLATE